MARFRFVPESILLAICVVSTAVLAAENNCISCHQDPTFYAQYPKLYQYYQEWLVSPHKQSGATCDDCHGGNSSATSMTKAHSGVLAMSDNRSTLHYQNQPKTCGQCHNSERAQFIESKHYRALMGQRAAPTCTTCHPAMSGRPEYRVIVLNACRNCHGEGNSENLPLIVEQAEHVFHQLNMARGLLGWTKIYYESRGWPENSEAHVRNLDKRYRAILNRVHQFDLEQTDDAMIEILGELTQIFDAARRAHGERGKAESEGS